MVTKSIYICTYIHMLMKDKAKFFKALGDETRLKIVSCLLSHEHCACEFTVITDKDQTTNSRHLRVLVEAGILDYRKEGRNIIYKIKSDEIRKMLKDMGIEEIETCCTGC